MTYCWAYITATNLDEAKSIGKKLVEERLAACVNIWPEVISIYRWKENIEEGTETAFIAKTTSKKFADVKKRVQELHSYDNPCVIQLPITEGSPSYLTWIDQETSI